MIEEFEKKGYRFHGTGAVEICRWTKNALLGRGVCYKQKFYGVPAHRCMEFSPSALWCNNNCVYCWRPEELMVPARGVRWTDPVEMVEALVEKRRSLLMGFKGNSRVNKRLLEEAMEPSHFAISLSGEPTAYPHLSELIAYLKSRPGHFSTFLVTNGQYPFTLESLKVLPTQLYLSLTAPNPTLYRRVSVPTEKDAWERLLHSCDFLARADTRTVARITPIKGLNMTDVEGWRALVERCNSHFVEFKGYSWIGFSQHRLKLENVPSLEEVREFATRVMSGLPFSYMDEDKKSRVVVFKNQRREAERVIKQ